MDTYHIALFIHLLALIVAAGATTVTKLAAARRARAKTIADVLDWHGVLMSTSKLFPLCLAAFVITGSYMLSVAHADVWRSGFVVAGLVGVVLLFASGTFLGIKGKALGDVLEKLALRGADQPPPVMVPPTLVVALPVINTGIAIGVVFDMVTKPTSIPVALGVVVIGIALGAAKGFRRAPVPVQAPRPSAASV